jgi:hypothetical protein
MANISISHWEIATMFGLRWIKHDYNEGTNMFMFHGKEIVSWISDEYDANESVALEVLESIGKFCADGVRL